MAITQLGFGAQPSGGTATITLSYTCHTGTNRKLVVFACGRSATDVTGITYNGISLSRVRNDILSGSRQTAIYYLDDASFPSVGTYNIVATYDASLSAGRLMAVELDGADQGAFAAGEQGFNYLGSATSNTVALAIGTAGSWMIGCGNCQDGITAYDTTASGQTVISNGPVGSGRGFGFSREEFASTSGSENYTVTTTGTCTFFGVSAVVVAPASSGTSVAMTGSDAAVAVAAGTMVGDIGVPLTGSGAGISVAAGSFGVAVTAPIAGSAAGIAVDDGDLTPSSGTEVALTGSGAGISVAAGSFGVTIDLALSGLTATVAGAIGALVPDVALGLTGATAGQAMTSGQWAPAVAPALTGAGLGVTGAVGSMTLSVALPLTGAAASIDTEAGDMFVPGVHTLAPVDRTFYDEVFDSTFADESAALTFAD